MPLKDKIVYTTVRGNQVVLKPDDDAYEVTLNGAPVLVTDNETEAQLVAESIDLALIILEANGSFGSIGEKQ